MEQRTLLIFGSFLAQLKLNLGKGDIMKMIVLFFSILTVLTASAAINDQDRAKLLSEVNLLPNPGFEASTGGWTASAGTFSATSTNPFTGKLSGAWNPSAGSETLSSEAITIQQGFLGRTCQAEMLYTYSGSSGDLVLEALDTGSAVATLDIDPASTARKAQLVFDCPDTNTDTLQFRLRSTVDAGQIKFDDSFLGRDRNTFQLSQAQSVGSLTVEPASGCSWQTSSNTFQTLTDSDCAGQYAGTGQLIEPQNAVNAPGFSVETLNPGVYIVHAQFRSFDTSGELCAYRLQARLNSQATLINGPPNLEPFNGDSPMSLMMQFEVTETATNNDVNIQLRQQSGSSNCGISNTQTDSDSVFFTVQKFPLNSAEAITLNTSGFYIDASIGNGNPGLGLTSDSGNFEYPTDSNLVLTKAAGSADVDIACDDGEAGSGTTCSSGDEQAGIRFDVFKAGDYKVCASFGVFQNLPSSANTLVNTTFRLDRTQDSDFTILQSGFSQPETFFRLTTGTGTNANQRELYFCDTFQLPVGSNTIRIAKFTNVSGSPTTNNMDSPIRFTVHQTTESIVTPVFTDLQNDLVNRPTTGNTSNERICRVGSGSTGSASGEDPNGCVTSFSALGGGVQRVNWNAGTWSDSSYTCNCQAVRDTGEFRSCLIQTIDQNFIEVKGFNDGGTSTGTNITYRMQCAGVSGN
jgi:hypothetical protein